MVGEKSSALLQAVNYNGAPREEPIQSLQCELVSELTRATVSLERRGLSQYEISYQPTIKGRHQLHIKVDDQHIITIGGVEIPWGITFNQRGEVVVAEVKGKCVSISSSSGEKLRSFGTHVSVRDNFFILVVYQGMVRGIF